MSASRQRYVLLGLGGVWCVLILMRVLTAEVPPEEPLQFVSGRPAAKTRATIGVSDPWHVKRMIRQAREMPEGPKKNIFASLGESTSVGATTVVAKRANPAMPAALAAPPPSPPLPSSVVAAPPPAPPGPTPEELAAQAARQQEELKLKQLREQMGQYRYLGYLSQQGVQKAFVGKGRDIYIIRKGDKLDGKFVVASIDAATIRLREPITSLEALLDLKPNGDHGPS
ncbi:MAG: hypothetical protein NTX84_05545 [Nitrospirae bacterium]|nr:hypothetical protein [Nitrospirota bacterium]